MDISRRGFLKAFGLTAAATLVEPTRATLSLFGSGEAKAATSAMGHHLVVFKRPVCVPVSGMARTKARPRGSAIIPPIYQDAPVVARVQSQFPQHSSWLLDEGYGSWDWDGEIIVPVAPGGDPYIGFYKASEQIRQMFADKALQRLKGIQSAMRPAHQIVTVIHTPIHARPARSVSGDPFQAGEGFEVACDCDTRVVMNPNLDGWETYSQFGEIPIEVPSELEIKSLLQYDTDIVTRSGKGWRRYQRT